MVMSFELIIFNEKIEAKGGKEAEFGRKLAPGNFGWLMFFA